MPHQRTFRDDLPQTGQKHPDEYQRDLNPHHMAGQNIGERSQSRPAADVKEAVEALRDFTMDELREVSVVTPGARLEQGGVYVNLHDPERRPFTATAEMICRKGELCVRKRETPFNYWNRIIRAGPAERRQ